MIKNDGVMSQNHEETSIANQEVAYENVSSEMAKGQIGLGEVSMDSWEHNYYRNISPGTRISQHGWRNGEMCTEKTQCLNTEQHHV